MNSGLENSSRNSPSENGRRLPALSAFDTLTVIPPTGLTSTNLRIPL